MKTMKKKAKKKKRPSVPNGLSLEFRKMDTENKGYLNYKQFETLIKDQLVQMNPNTPEEITKKRVQQLWKLLDKQPTSTITLKELLQVLQEPENDVLSPRKKTEGYDYIPKRHSASKGLRILFANISEEI